MKKAFLCCSLVLICICCKRFDSNKLNHNLIQGYWEQTEISYSDLKNDSLITEQPEHATLLHFTMDSCIEYIPHLEKKRLYNYLIKDYFIKLEEDSMPTQYLEIVKLTSDSLILKTKHQRWGYIRTIFSGSNN